MLYRLYIDSHDFLEMMLLVIILEELRPKQCDIAKLNVTVIWQCDTFNVSLGRMWLVNPHWISF